MKASHPLRCLIGFMIICQASAAEAQEVNSMPVNPMPATLPAETTVTHPGFEYPVDGIMGAPGHIDCIGLEYRFLPQITAKHVTGDGVGYQFNYTSLELMVPYRLTDKADLGFLDIRGLINGDGRLAANLGGGYRCYCANINSVVGVNAYYDFRDTDFGSYDQLGFGFESLGRWVDFRTNFYFPIGTDETLLEEFTQVMDFGRVVDQVQIVRKALTARCRDRGSHLAADRSQGLHWRLLLRRRFFRRRLGSERPVGGSPARFPRAWRASHAR